ncbi:hypothetical protein IHE44_0011822, partial [Lamprotornis superbus]
SLYLPFLDIGSPLSPHSWTLGPPCTAFPALPVPLSLIHDPLNPPNLFVSPVLHSLRYLHVAVSEPSPGIPEFMIIGYLDGIPFVRYDSERGRMEPLTEWIKDGAEPGHWDVQTQTSVQNQHMDAWNLETLRDRYNQSRGEWGDLSVRGSRQDGYDGWDYISFDLGSGRFVAADSAAEVTRRRWEGETNEAERWTNYLGNICPEWLQKYVKYGQKELDRKEPPDVHVSGKEEHGTLILSCHVYGFYPSSIAVNWMKGDEIWDQETEWGGIVPNSDGTFHTWARIEARPEEREQYRCRVEHPGMSEPGIFAWEPTSGGNLIVEVAESIIAAIIIILIVLIGFVVWKHQFVLHSLRYMHVAVSEPSLGVPPFMSIGYLDGIPFTRCDSEWGRVEPLTQWIKDGAEPGYWDVQTQICVQSQHVAARDLETAWDQYNQSRGDVRGSFQDGYDGQDYISFDLGSGRFVAADSAAEVTRRRWEHEKVAEVWINYLEHECPEWLQKYIGYRQKELDHKEPPDVHVSGKEEHGTLILSCHAYGFYPSTITVNWMKGDEIWDQETEWGGIVPNSDGTFHTWARIEARPEEREQYRCRVEHPGMSEPGIYAWDPTSGGNLIVVVAVSIAAIIIILIVLIGFVVWKRQSGRRDRNEYSMAASEYQWWIQLWIPSVQIQDGSWVPGNSSLGAENGDTGDKDGDNRDRDGNTRNGDEDTRDRLVTPGIRMGTPALEWGHQEHNGDSRSTLGTPKSGWRHQDWDGDTRSRMRMPEIWEHQEQVSMLHFRPQYSGLYKHQDFCDQHEYFIIYHNGNP